MNAKNVIENAMVQLQEVCNISNPVGNASKENYFKVLLLALKNEGLVSKENLANVLELMDAMPASPSAMRQDPRWSRESKSAKSGKAVDLSFLD